MISLVYLPTSQTKASLIVTVLGMVSTNNGVEDDSDSGPEIDSVFRAPESDRSPLMENTSLLNSQSSHQADSSATAFHGSGADTPQIIQQQQYLLQEVISTQQGIIKKQSDFDHKLLSLQQQVSEGINSCSSVASSSDDKKFKVTRYLTVCV